jgi:hypothetical protein
MLHPAQLEELMVVVASMDRASLVDQFHNYHARFAVDFSDDFLARTPLDKLRHIFVAMCLQNDRLPESMSQAA